MPSIHRRRIKILLVTTEDIKHCRIWRKWKIWCHLNCECVNGNGMHMECVISLKWNKKTRILSDRWKGYEAAHEKKHGDRVPIVILCNNNKWIQIKIFSFNLLMRLFPFSSISFRFVFLSSRLAIVIVSPCFNFTCMIKCI